MQESWTNGILQTIFEPIVLQGPTDPLTGSGPSENFFKIGFLCRNETSSEWLSNTACPMILFWASFSKYFSKFFGFLFWQQEKPAKSIRKCQTLILIHVPANSESHRNICFHLLTTLLVTFLKLYCNWFSEEKILVMGILVLNLLFAIC